jgi:hypothetical protein
MFKSNQNNYICDQMAMVYRFVKKLGSIIAPLARDKLRREYIQTPPQKCGQTFEAFQEGHFRGAGSLTRLTCDQRVPIDLSPTDGSLLSCRPPKGVY